MTNQIELTYYFTKELNQLDLVNELESEHQNLKVKRECVESEKQIEPTLKAVPCFVFKTNSEVVKLFGEQTKIELSTLIKEIV